eukprot:SAG31_NODE_14854_length_784_cov_1.109489_1_plen_168_part_10
MAFEACDSIVDDSGDMDDAISSRVSGLIIHAFNHAVEANTVAEYLDSIDGKPFDSKAAAEALSAADEVKLDLHVGDSDDDLVLSSTSPEDEYIGEYIVLEQVMYQRDMRVDSSVVGRLQTGVKIAVMQTGVLPDGEFRLFFKIDASDGDNSTGWCNLLGEDEKPIMQR